MVSRLGVKTPPNVPSFLESLLVWSGCCMWWSPPEGECGLYSLCPTPCDLGPRGAHVRVRLADTCPRTNRTHMLGQATGQAALAEAAPSSSPSPATGRVTSRPSLSERILVELPLGDRLDSEAFSARHRLARIVAGGLLAMLVIMALGSESNLVAQRPGIDTDHAGPHRRQPSEDPDSRGIGRVGDADVRSRRIGPRDRWTHRVAFPVLRTPAPDRPVPRHQGIRCLPSDSSCSITQSSA